MELLKPNDRKYLVNINAKFHEYKPLVKISALTVYATDISRQKY